MDNEIKVYPYHRDKKNDTKIKNKRKTKLWTAFWSSELRQALKGRWILFYLTALFMGRAMIMGELVPFGLAFMAAATTVVGAKNFGVAMAVMGGLATVSSDGKLFGSCLTIVIGYFMLRYVIALDKKHWFVLPGVVLVTDLVVKSVLVAYDGGVMYGYISVIFDAVFACVLTIAFMQALPPLWQRTVPGRISQEAVFSMLLLLGGVVAGTGDLAIDVISLRGVVSRFIVLLAASLGGMGLGASAGAVVGIIPGVAYVVSPAIIGAYSFAGFMAGLLHGFGRIGVAMGFFLGNILLSIYITDYGNMMEVMAETAIATVFFCLMPHAWLENIANAMPMAKNISFLSPPTNQARIKELTADRMRGWGNVFDEMAKSFQQVGATVEKAQEEDGLEKLFEEVGQKVCKGCALYRTCWEREFYRTYQQILDLLTLVETYGQLTIDDLPEGMKKRCARLKEMAITITCLYDNFKINNYWQKKLLESRQLVCQQLQGVSQILQGVSNDLEKDIEQCGEIEKAIIKRLKKEGIPVHSVLTHYCSDGRLEVGITRSACNGNMECRQKVAPIVSATTGQNMCLAEGGCCLEQGETECSFRLYDSLNYYLTLGTAGYAQKSGCSGDTYAALQLKGGKYALVLSDGMGTGKSAYLESSSTVKLLQTLLESGFDKNMAVRTVNSILILRSPQENFATVDMAVIDLYSGESDMVKICAAPSFLIGKNGVTIIEEKSLPVGIIENIEVTNIHQKLARGDMLVLLTDGVLEAYSTAKDRETQFAQLLRELYSLHPQEAAEIILQIAQTSAEGKKGSKDDMTVLVAKVERD